MDPALESPCCLCGDTASHCCAAAHGVCGRCHRAAWVGQQKLGAAIGANSVDDPAVVGVCPAPECFQRLDSPAAPGAAARAAPPPGRLVPLGEASPEYETAVAKFRRTIALTGTSTAAAPVIDQVYRVDNRTLVDMFELCRARFAQETRDTSEKLMFHGTDRAAAGSIARAGFDIRFAGAHGQAYGPGIYFAEKASYSHTYAVKDWGGNLCMIVARVLPGRSSGGRAARGAARAHGPSYYDSSAGPGIVAVRREQQALPVYVIYYHV